MHSSEHARRSQRRRPELNINTVGTKSLTRYSTAPQFSPEFRPPVPAKGNLRTGSLGKSSRAPTQNMRDAAEVETFLDMLTPADMSSNKENDRPVSMEPPRQPNVRDSHDLSLPQRHVRDSLVSNMLLSLDQFSMGQMNSEGSAPNYDNPLYSFGGGGDEPRGGAAMGPTIRRRPNHGYTYSSDYEMADSDSRISSQQSRGRRSNSSSGFQSSLGRINSMRESLHRGSQPGTPRMLHSRGGKGSKSSSTNSIDQGSAQVLSSQRWAHSFGGRSSSFDYGQRPSTSAQPWHIEFSNTFFNEDLDAAPTPTVPGGPRRLAPAPSMPSFPRPEPPPEPAPSKGPGVERKRSTRSSRSATVGRQAQSKFNTNNDIPALPAFDLDSAPAPHVGYEKAKDPVPQTAAPLPPPKERSGFFRKIFGGFRDTSAESPPPPSQTSPYVSSGSTETVGSRGGQHINQTKTQSTPPSRQSHHSTHGPTLQKKPSSFFRRRKKSVNDAAPPPPLPASVAAPHPVMPSLQLPQSQGPSKPEPSPATSLSRAMSPYLKQAATAPVLASPGAEDAHNDERRPTPPPRDEAPARNVRGFSPDYEPPPSAIIRPVHHSASNQDMSRSNRQSKLRTDTTARQAPQPPHPARSGSFLNDNSDSESSPQRVAQRAVDNYRAGSRTSQKDASSGAPSPITPLIKSPDTIVKADVSPPRDIIVVDSTDDDEGTRLTLPIQSASSPRNTLSPTDGPRIRSSMSLPNVRVESSESTPSTQTTPKPAKPIDEPEFVVGEPTEDDKQKAQKIFDGNEDFIQKEKAAAWMGEEGPVRQRTLQAYMDLYDFKNSSIVNALRDVCCRLILRAETQQVDRILVAFSKRWCDCNPNHGFKSIDVVHTTCYSIMLLNTDLHVADIESKMTRSQFVKNTMTTIRQALAESVPDVFERPSILPGKNQNLGVDEGRTSGDHDRTTSFRNSFISPLRSESSMGHRDDPDGCGPLVKAPFEGPLRAWEAQVEIVLKETYNSIRDDRLPLYGAEPAQSIPGSSSLSVMGILKRTPSVLSKAPSEGGASTRGRINDTTRTNTSRWASKSRSRARLGNNGFSSSRTSFDDNNSLWSPTPSSATWSRYSLGRTQGSGSIDSFGSAFPRGDFQQSIGFANALSQAIDTMGSAQSLASDDMKSAQLLDDESLELAGPPWIKEGIVVHKHHLDGIDKKAKDRNWSEVFAVIQRGQMSIFSFSSNKSTRSKGRSRQNTATQKGAVVGGGNWQENATNMGTFSLKQTLASALPPPGYSRTRPHVWALSLPTGAVHLFHVGTAEICKEFVTTANYWSARLSTHPLVGGISNIEYGWSDSIVHNSLVNAINNKDPSSAQNDTSRPESAAAGRTSMQSRTSIRSGSFDFGHVRGKSSTDMSQGASRHGGSKLPGDKIHIADWQPPTQSLRPSNAAEPEQLQTLLTYVRGIEDELQAHNALRSPMLLAFTPRGHNANKAMSNWERKSSYLLREIVKFRTYVDCLQEAERRRGEIYAEREVAQRAARGEEAGSIGSEEDFAKEFGMRGAAVGGAGAGAEDDEGEETLKPKARA
ncbi:uncharacterized protein E0L32_005135 [Thyridium curvatum]|uniref:SEC7 domain-containing protein n=1 Tax=Thyridium curvatum TaxID=1093900 RepID=A0A507BDZ5_9PEZI|nr:uncharacterized protein E0L32_005135 [Thyridium curvatum]TPX14740.1 hypothetical protein E0L32_005135 [Thyridium curvatum]